MTISDGIILAVAAFSFWSGWRRGFLRTLLGPLSLLIGTGVSYYYYIFTHDLFKSLLIGILGPLVLNFTLSFFLNIWNQASGNKDHKTTPLSRTSGGILNLLWTGGLMVLVLMLLMLVPPHVYGIEKLKKDLDRSFTCSWLNHFVKNKISSQDKMTNTLNALDPSQIKNIEDTEEYHALMEDEKIQSILSNEETMRQIHEKDITKLLGNPQFLELFQDPAVLKKIMDLNTRMLKEPSKEETPVGTAR